MRWLLACVVVVLVHGCTDLGTHVRSLEIVPVTSQLPAGSQERWSAVATRYDGSTLDISEQATWASSAQAIAIVDPGGLVRAVEPGEAFVSITFDGLSATEKVVVLAPGLARIEIVTGPKLPRGVAQQVAVIGTFSDGTTSEVTSRATWASSDPDVLEVSASGVVRAVGVGMATITAEIDGLGDTIDIVVTDAALSRIVLAPDADTLAKGLTRQLTAIGHFTDDSTFNITSQVTWQSTAPVVASVDGSGLVRARQRGLATISARLDSGYGQIELQVTDPLLVSLAVVQQNVKLPEGFAERLTTIGTYTDGSRADLTTLSQWSSSNAGVAAIGSTAGSHGLLQGISAGTAAITAATPGPSGTISASTAVQITTAQLVSLAVGVGKATVPLRFGEDLVATGTFDDGSTEDLTAQVTWTSSAPAFTVTASGRAIAQSAGMSTIMASRGSITASRELIAVAATLSSITITPEMPTVKLSEFRQMTATGRFSDGQDYPITDDLGWDTSNSTIMRVTNAPGARGIVQPLTEGAALVQASEGTMLGSTQVLITPP